MDKEEMIEIIQKYEHELWETLSRLQNISGKKSPLILSARSRWGGMNQLLDKLAIEPIL